jgi:hypothetical protein
MFIHFAIYFCKDKIEKATFSDPCLSFKILLPFCLPFTNESKHCIQWMITIIEYLTIMKEALIPIDGKTLTYIDLL